MAKDNKTPIVTKKHLARVERERIQTRNILIVSVVIIALVVILVGWGVVKTYLIEPRQAVVTIGDEKVTTRQFQAYARFTRGQLIDQYAQYYQFMEWFQNDQDSQNSILQTLSQISYQLEPEYLGESTIDALIADVLIRQEAKTLGITVSEAEIDKALEQFLGYYPSGTPTSEPLKTAVPTSTLSAIQLTLVAPTPTAIPSEVPTEQSVEATPTSEPPTATSTTAEEATPSASSTVAPTPTEYTAKLFNNNMDSYLAYIGISESDLRWIFESQLLRERVYASITADIPTESDQVWARQIVVADEETATQVVERLNAGEDFATLAAELSTDQATSTNGGDMGWFGIGTLEQAAEKIIFNLPIGKISDPIQTTTGWIIIQVLGHEVRPIPESGYQTLLDQTFDDWLTAARTAAEVDIIDIYLERVPTEPSIPLSMQLGS